MMKFEILFKNGTVKIVESGDNVVKLVSDASKINGTIQGPVLYLVVSEIIMVVRVPG